MSIDYDAPRIATDELPPDRDLEAVKASLSTDREGVAGDLEEVELILPGADVSGIDLVIELVPQRSDEFVCPSCFLVRHRSQRAVSGECCRDCA